VEVGHTVSVCPGDNAFGSPRSDRLNFWFPARIMDNVRSQLRRGKTRVGSAAAILRLRPFADSTESGRSRERYRRVALAGLTGGLSKGIRLLTTIVAVPVTVGYLGAERFGLWMSLSSLIGLTFAFADLGLGCMLQNAVSAANGENDRNGMQRDVSSAIFVLTTVPAALLLCFFGLYPHLPWDRIFNLRTSMAAHGAGPAAALFVVCYLAAIPLGVAGRVQVGFQDGFRANSWDSVAAALGLGGTLVAARLRADLPMLVLASSGAPLIAIACNSLVEFGWRRPWLWPHWRWVDWRQARALMGGGVQLLLASAGTLALVGAPILVIGNRFGAVEAGPYALAYKILTVPMTLFSIFFMPLWPAYADAKARGDLRWIRRTLSRSRKLVAFLVIPVVTALALATPWMVSAWTSGRLRPSLPEACAIALFVIFMSLETIYALPLLACGRLRVPAAAHTIAGALAFLPLVLPLFRLSTVNVPLWVAACEALALAAMVIDVRKLCAESPSPHH
jgi:O-antigen/teichoic acid export membrane protein